MLETSTVARCVDILKSYFEPRPDAPARGLTLADGWAAGRFDGLHVASAFQALFHTRTLQPVAHEALLRARDGDGRPVAPGQALERPETASDIVYFDRLCRAVHAANFATQAGPQDQLFLNVSGGHLLNVVGGSHGDVFETLLRHCGLEPSQVVLEIVESRIDDPARLAQAVAAYQKRGFRVAIDDFGCQHSNFDRLWMLEPDIVKLDRSLIVQSEVNPRARTILPKLVEIIHDLGAEVVCEGIETAAQHALAEAVGADFVQGFLYARPHPVLRRGPAARP